MLFVSPGLKWPEFTGEKCMKSKTIKVVLSGIGVVVLTTAPSVILSVSRSASSELIDPTEASEV